MLTLQGEAYVKAAIYVIQEQERAPLAEAELLEFLGDEAAELEETEKQTIAKCLAKESECPEDLLRTLVYNSWIAELEGK